MKVYSYILQIKLIILWININNLIILFKKISQYLIKWIKILIAFSINMTELKIIKLNLKRFYLLKLIQKNNKNVIMNKFLDLKIKK